MNKKRGFTLVELIASVCILAILSTIVITYSVKKVNDVKKSSYDLMINSIELAAKQYVIDKGDDLTSFKTNDYIYITLDELINNNYFTNNLIDTINDELIPTTNEVYVTKSSDGILNSTYDDKQAEKDKLQLNGSYNIYLRKNEIYVDEGISDKNGSTLTEAVVDTDGLDVTKIGTYTITYTYNDSTITRNVIVIKERDSITDSNILLLDHINNLYSNNNAKVMNGLTKDGTSDQNIRYAGSNVNVKNYVSFNNELWRIVGIFNNKIKIVRNDTLSIQMSWDSSSDSVNSGFGDNTWETSDVYSFLNNYYLNGGTCNYCNNSSQDTCTNICSDYITNIDIEYVNMIDNGTFYTGEINNNSIANIYVNEKTSSNTSKIGLLNVSDYLYASSCTDVNKYNNQECIGKNWLNSIESIWTINKSNANDYSVYKLSDGNIEDAYASIANKVKPVLYLKSDIEVVNGTGTINNPYIIKEVEE